MNYDILIIGGGIYGLYSAKFLSDLGHKVLLIEIDSDLFKRASYVNQARVHNGYHYPRSLETAMVAHKYYEKFKNDFSDSINDNFEHIYAVSKQDSLTSDSKFVDFCERVGLPYEQIDSSKYFLKNSVFNAYKVKECAFDFKKVKNKLLEDKKFDIFLNSSIKSIRRTENKFYLELSSGIKVSCSGIVNTTYSSVNQINSLFGYNFFDIKYELCEMILCKSPQSLSDKGVTVVDGHYFSIMPFGLQGYHSLYSVEHTVSQTSWSGLPEFNCQGKMNTCSKMQLNDCNSCCAKPKTMFNKVIALAKKYLIDSNIKYIDSIFAVKVVSKSSEHNDSRLVSIEKHSESPIFISIFSGKINSIYEIDKTLMDSFGDKK